MQRALARRLWLDQATYRWWACADIPSLGPRLPSYRTISVASTVRGFLPTSQPKSPPLLSRLAAPRERLLPPAAAASKCGDGGNELSLTPLSVLGDPGRSSATGELAPPASEPVGELVAAEEFSAVSAQPRERSSSRSSNSRSASLARSVACSFAISACADGDSAHERERRSCVCV